MISLADSQIWPGIGARDRFFQPFLTILSFVTSASVSEEICHMIMVVCEEICHDYPRSFLCEEVSPSFVMFE